MQANSTLCNLMATRSSTQESRSEYNDVKTIHVTEKDGSGETLSQDDAFKAWTMRTADVARELGTNIDTGLTNQEAEGLEKKYGPNLLDEGGGVSLTKIIISQIANAMVLVLLVCMVISFAIKDWISGGVIAGVAGINVFVGILQEYSAAKTMESLRSMSSPTARVIRNGEDETVPSKDLVPGDLIVVKVGDTVPADCRLIQGMNFETEEALLTGESMPVVKEYDITIAADAPVGDRVNMAFSSSTVSKGRATAIVTGTGMNTEIGRIAASLNDKESKIRKVPRDEQGKARKRDYSRAFFGTIKDLVGNFLGLNIGTPLHRLMSRLAVYLFFVAVIIAIVAMAAQKMDVTREVAVYAIVVAIAMIPASMVVVLTITMAMGTKAMAQRHVVIRKLDSLEALGSVNDICSDKTGTLTQGKMVVRRAWIPSWDTLSVTEATDPLNPNIGLTATEEGHVVKEIDDANKPLSQYMLTAGMANIANINEVHGEWKANGDPTEIAIQVFVTRLHHDRAKFHDPEDHKRLKFSHLAEYPFDSSIKRMSAVYQDNKTDDITIFTKGATERILDLCDTWYGTEKGNDKPIPFTDVEHKLVFDKVDELASEGLRVLAFARRGNADPSVDYSKAERNEIEKNLTFLGLVGIYDPPRPESAPAVKLAHRAGVNVHMLTGDHPSTATAIAKEVGIIPKKLDDLTPEVVKAMVMTASQFDALSDEQIDALPVLPLVVARCSPQTKVRMIDALHRRGAFCAMTGDGVNDSPSLKKADVGIAMGMAGSDVAKEASDIVLSDDNFASILSAVEEGRRMTDNIQKFVLHLLAGNVSQVLFLLIGLAFKAEDGFSVFPVSPVEVLWIIMITSGFPAMGLGMEKAQLNVMKRPPASAKNSIFTVEVILDMLVYGFAVAIICVVTFSSLIYGYWGGRPALGRGCNETYTDSCYAVFRTRSVTFAQMTWCLLVLAWEMIDLRRSMFYLTPNSPKGPYKQFFADLWRNQALFWSIIGGFVTLFPLCYIPVINKIVFKHLACKWEWAVAVGGLIVFIGAAELWKWCKRIYFRRHASEYAVHNPETDLGNGAFSRYNSMATTAV